MNSCKAIATRIVNAENRFIKAVQEQFGKTEAESKKILEIFKAEKIVKIDPVTGSFTLTNGIFWDSQVMDNALAL